MTTQQNTSYNTTIKSKPEKQTKQIDSILTKTGAKSEKILKNQGK